MIPERLMGWYWLRHPLVYSFLSILQCSLFGVRYAIEDVEAESRLGTGFTKNIMEFYQMVPDIHICGVKASYPCFQVGPKIGHGEQVYLKYMSFRTFIINLIWSIFLFTWCTTCLIEPRGSGTSRLISFEEKRELYNFESEVSDWLVSIPGKDLNKIPRSAGGPSKKVVHMSIWLLWSCF